MSQFLDLMLHQVWGKLQWVHSSCLILANFAFSNCIWLLKSVNSSFIYLLIEWNTKLQNSHVFKLVPQSLTMQPFSCPHKVWFLVPFQNLSQHLSESWRVTEYFLQWMPPVGPTCDRALWGFSFSKGFSAAGGAHWQLLFAKLDN